MSQTKMTVTEAAKILGVAPDADVEQIQTAFRRAIASQHPDLGGDTDTTIRILAARATLTGAGQVQKTSSDRPRSFVRRRRFRWR